MFAGLVDHTENETENKGSSQVARRKEPELFTEEMCSKLRVPCRFVTEHPCCSLPQGIDMMGRSVLALPVRKKLDNLMTDPERWTAVLT